MLESLEIEGKLLIPTKILFETLVTHVQSYLAQSYLQLRYNLIELHNTVAMLARTWYKNPIGISRQWFEQGILYTKQLHATFRNQWFPQMEDYYAGITAKTENLTAQLVEQVNYAVENPDQITAEFIESLNQELAELGTATNEILNELQVTGTRLIRLLLEKPMETLETGTMELLNALLDNYFALVSHILISL